MEKQEGFNYYSEDIIEYVRAANDFCDLLANAGNLKRSELLGSLRELLSRLYLYALKLPELEAVYEEGNQKFVTEEEYMVMKDSLSSKLEYLDDYPETGDNDLDGSGMPVVAYLSEDLSDIYQDLKNFIMLYRLGSDQLMNDALWETKFSFETYWGTRLVNALRYIHRRLVSDEPVNDEESTRGEDKRQSGPDTSEWFISRRQDETRERTED